MWLMSKIDFHKLLFIAELLVRRLDFAKVDCCSPFDDLIGAFRAIGSGMYGRKQRSFAGTVSQTYRKI